MAKKGDVKHEVLGIVLLCIGVFALYCVGFPEHSGIIGKYVYDIFRYLFGTVSYFVPFVCMIVGWRMFYDDAFHVPSQTFGVLLCLFSMSALFGLPSVDSFTEDTGGVIGRMGARTLRQLFGTFGAYSISFFASIVSLIIIARISVRAVIAWCVENVKTLFGAYAEKEKELSEDEKPAIHRSAKKKKEPTQAVAEDVSIVKPKPLEKPDRPETTTATKAATQEKIPAQAKQPKKDYVFPPIELLQEPSSEHLVVPEEELKQNAAVLQTTLINFDVDARVTNIHPGPVITRYEVELAPGVKVNTVTSLENDICLTMKATSIRILAPIPGKSAIGIEIPNQHPCPVMLRELIDTKEFRDPKSKLMFAVGKTVSGQAQVADIATMPHLLIAGATGSGKSVCVNTLIMSILYKAAPWEVKFILIDPKMVELSTYQDMPHLYAPVITNPKEASKVLQHVVLLMEQRYQKFAEHGARNIEAFNAKMEKLKEPKESYLVVIIDELADLMLVASRDVEESIARLTQMARAVGIHVVLATQRPSVDVITGVIKANLPSRIAFQVLSKGDSRVILDANGADDLLGRGDMMFLANGAPKPVRLQGAFLSDAEIHRVLEHINAQAQPDYGMYYKNISSAEDKKNADGGDEEDEQFRRALQLIYERRKASYELLKANGFSGPKASNMLSLMEMKGFIEKPAGTNRWDIFLDEIEAYLKNAKEG